jgi:preprotein translocase subunit SecD
MNTRRRYLWLLPIALSFLIVLACCCLLLVGTVGLLAFTYAHTSAPAMVLILAPDTTATVSPGDLDAARAVVQRRLEASGMVRARVVVDGNRLRVEFADPVDRPAVSQLVTEVGATVFWDSPGPVPVGTATPPEAQVILTDADIAQARAVFVDTRWQVAVTLTPAGAQKLAAYTQANVGHYLVIARDGVVLSAPVVRTPILDGQAVIAGQFDATAARTLAAQLTGGRLPYRLVVVETR